MRGRFGIPGPAHGLQIYLSSECKETLGESLNSLSSKRSSGYERSSYGVLIICDHLQPKKPPCSPNHTSHMIDNNIAL